MEREFLKHAQETRDNKQREVSDTFPIPGSHYLLRSTCISVFGLYESPLYPYTINSPFCLRWLGLLSFIYNQS